jgi:tryptophan synthase alpha chain
MSINLLFDQLADIRSNVSIPLLLMGYINPVLKFGVENFCSKCVETGIDGIILPDLPPDIYLEKYSGLFEKNNLYNIFLITPRTTDDRIRMIDSISKGFIYFVSSYKITGKEENFTGEQLSYFERIRESDLKNPGLIGFGISNRSTFMTACNYTSGAIIGSAFVSMLTASGGDTVNIKNFVENIIM